MFAFRTPPPKRQGSFTLVNPAVNKELVLGQDHEVLDPVDSTKPARVQPYGTSTQQYTNYYKAATGDGAFKKSGYVAFRRKPASEASMWNAAVEENRRAQKALDAVKGVESTRDALLRIYTPKRQDIGFLQDLTGRSAGALREAADILTPPVVTPGTQPPVVTPGTQPPVVTPGTQPPVVDPGTQPPVVDPGTQPPVVTPGTQPPVVVPTTQPPVVVPSTQPPVVVPPAIASGGQSQLVTDVSAGKAVMAYFQNNEGTVGPVLIFSGPDEPATVTNLTSIVGPVTISTRGDEQFFIVPQTNVDPGEATPWFGPARTSFQGGLAMPGAITLDAPIYVFVESGSNRDKVTIGPALGVNTAVQLKLPDGLISETQQLDTLDRAYGNQSTALAVYTPKRAFSTYDSIVAAIAPPVDSSQAPPSYPKFLLDIVNEVIFDGSNTIEPWALIDGGRLTGPDTGVNPVYDWLYATAGNSQAVRETQLFKTVMARCRVYGFMPSIPLAVCNFLYAEAAYDQLVKYQRNVMPDVTRAGTLPELTSAFNSSSVNESIDKAFQTLEAIGKKILKASVDAMIKPASGVQRPAMTDAQILAEIKTNFRTDPPADPAAVNSTLLSTSLASLVGGALSFGGGVSLGYFGDQSEMVLNQLELWGPLFFRNDGSQYIRAMLYDRRFSFALRNGIIFAGLSAFSVSTTLFFGYSNMAALGLCVGLFANVIGRMSRTARIQRPNLDMVQQPDQALINIVENLPNMVREIADQVVADLVIERARAPDAGGREAVGADMAVRFRLYSDGMTTLRSGPPLSTDRRVLREALQKVLRSFRIPDPEIDGVLSLMNVNKRKGFQFYSTITRGANASRNLLPVQLYELLNRNKENIFSFIDDYLETAAVSGGDSAEFRMEEALRFLFRFRLKQSTPLQVRNWCIMLSIMYGIANPQTLIDKVNAEPDPPPLDGDDDDDTEASNPPGGVIAGPTTGGTSPGMFDKPAAAPAPRADGSATMVSVPTPQFTDAPATMTLEAAMSQLADRTLSVQQVTRSGLPDSYSWYLMKARRRTLRALFFAAWTGLGASAQDTTQVLNFMDPTFLDTSLSTQEYSGLRIQGRHGSYPRQDAFWIANMATYAKYFAGLSSQIRVSYASTFATRIFGLRGKSYFVRTFALSPSELLQVAKNSREVLDIVVGDTTYSDSVPQGPPPTTEQARGYGTGPYDYTGP